MKKLRFVIVPVLLSILFVMASATIDGSKETEKVNSAIGVLKDFSKMKESIPHDLIAQCEGIVIVPNLINAGFVVGGKRGRGIAMIKLEDGSWSDPVFVTLTGGSIGFQIGVQSVDLVLVFRHKGVLTKVKDGDFTIGGDASAAAGPVGRSTSANTDYKLEAEVYSYSRSRGLFAGISINGSNLGIDKKANAAFYGSDISSEDIFASGKSSTEVVKTLKTTLKAM
ncbi:lipid-binding SYLF domain-containing protein [Mucilaginibacter frigoritolerans]|jgi:SH3 domain-containing YSC84-like protein 1|uniref:Lipid-binding SYLF domain-containing protein n=1 Tax=Mucilaginibacter frigoritolerans TaxID=652788 RepID=A0A562UAU5_9SPHI|nr:lipid-binding SYLF domain-containing protein [Mucilaginibacter frigoritolerans]TWJ02231.1 lipid-binding SYLF domain-containing protein [Mucilaginibacter frigoritolerans]